MSRPDRVIPIHPAPAPPSVVADALMREIAAALSRYAQDGQPHVIDLSAMPLSEDDTQRLDEQLGTGEVAIEIRSLLYTRVEETRYAGVWRVRHEDPDGSMRGEQIEITDIPEIVRASAADIGRSVQRLCADRAEEDA